MKTAVLTGIRSMKIVDRPTPAIVRDNDVLIRMVTVGVCGSDIHYYTTGRIGSQVVNYPFAVGHECAGIIEKTGKDAGLLKPGMAVTIDPAMHCGECDQCRSGRHHTCRTTQFLGCPGQADGCLSEYIVMPSYCCFPWPSGYPMDQAAAIEPLSIGYYTVSRADDLKNKTAVILGFGPIGMSVLFSAQQTGLKQVFVTDKLDYRLNIAKANGATDVLNPLHTDVVKAINTAVPLQADVIFECCGQQDAITQAIEMLKPGGKLVITGIPETDTIHFNMDLLRRKELTIINIRRQVNCVGPAIRLATSGTINLASMITHTFPFSHTQAAFDLVAGYHDQVMKAVIDFRI